MFHSRIKKDSYRSQILGSSGLIFLLLSFLMHLVPMLKLTGEKNSELNLAKKERIKIKIIDHKTIEESKDKRIIEAKQIETKPPVDSENLGQKNHATLKEKKAVATKQLREPEIKASNSKPKAQTSITAASLPKPPKDSFAKLKIDKKTPSSYQEFLDRSKNSLESEVQHGYQDAINDAFELSDAIDMNTREYRFIGYFTTLRKAIELVWVYPQEAAIKGHSGSVLLGFSIAEDGKLRKIKLLSSSGHPVLDEAILSAIKLASPFPPLPKGFGKDVLNVKGTFNYVLR